MQKLKFLEENIRDFIPPISWYRDAFSTISVRGLEWVRWGGGGGGGGGSSCEKHEGITFGIGQQAFCSSVKSTCRKVGLFSIVQ